VTLFRLNERPDLHEPTLLLSLSGWVDAAGAGTDAADHVAGDAAVIAIFDPDALFDYRSNRPAIRFEDGTLQAVEWPRLDLRHTRVGDTDLLVLSGSEPDLAWRALTAELAGLAVSLEVARLITVGAVPAAVPHTRPPPVLTTSGAPDQLLDDDVVLGGVLEVPGAAVSILTAGLEEAGIPAVGYWAQVPHYVGRPYAPAVIALVEKVSRRLGTPIPLGTLSTDAAEQRDHIDRLVAARPETAAFVRRLEEAFVEGSVPSADEIGAEVERFLRETADEDDDPFGG
jgi:hypothetical protein